MTRGGWTAGPLTEDRVLYDLAALLRVSTAAIHELCVAWGTARHDVIEVPALVPIEEAIPGFYRHMLTARKGVMVGVLPGRTESHVQALAKVYPGERRNRDAIVRADLAQGVTRYIQEQPATVRRTAEAAIATWVVDREPVRYATA